MNSVGIVNQPNYVGRELNFPFSDFYFTKEARTFQGTPRHQNALTQKIFPFDFSKIKLFWRIRIQREKFPFFFFILVSVRGLIVSIFLQGRDSYHESRRQSFLVLYKGSPILVTT